MDPASLLYAYGVMLKTKQEVIRLGLGQNHNVMVMSVLDSQINGIKTDLKRLNSKLNSNFQNVYDTGSGFDTLDKSNKLNKDIIRHIFN